MNPITNISLDSLPQGFVLGPLLYNIIYTFGFSTLLAESVAQGQFYGEHMHAYPLPTSKCCFGCQRNGSRFGQVGDMDVIISLTSKFEID